MVAPISVFPDVGAAFFGSYRGARNQRLQESAMRAEMAAAQAERQRQSQAREAFARLQGPDQRIEQVAGSTNFGPSPVEFTQDRITRQGLTPEQRALEEQRLAQNDPNLLMAYRQTRQPSEGPDLSAYSHILEALPAQLEAAESDEQRQQIIARADRVINSNGQILSPQQILDTAYAGYAPQEPEDTSAIREYQFAVNQGYQGTFQQYQTEQAAAARSQTVINPSAGPEDIQVVPQEIVESMGLPPGAYVWRRDAQGNVIPSPIQAPGGRSGRGPAPSFVEDEIYSNAISRLDNGDDYYSVVDDIVSLSEERAAAGQGRPVSRTLAEAELRARRAPPERMAPRDAATVAEGYYQSAQQIERQLRAVNASQEILDEWGNLASGLGANLAFIRGTPADNLETFFRGITSPMIIDELQALRARAQAMGERGSGFGQLTQNEIAIILQAQTLLDAGLPADDLARELRILGAELVDARAETDYYVQTYMPEVYSVYQDRQARRERVVGSMAEPAQAGAQQGERSTSDLLQQYGD